MGEIHLVIKFINLVLLSWELGIELFGLWFEMCGYVGDLFNLFILFVNELVFNSSMHDNNLNIHQQFKIAFKKLNIDGIIWLPFLCTFLCSHNSTIPHSSSPNYPTAPSSRKHTWIPSSSLCWLHWCLYPLVNWFMCSYLSVFPLWSCWSLPCWCSCLIFQLSSYRMLLNYQGLIYFQLQDFWPAGSPRLTS